MEQQLRLAEQKTLKVRKTRLKQALPLAQQVAPQSLHCFHPPCHIREWGSTKPQHRSSSSLGQGQGLSTSGSGFGQGRAHDCRAGVQAASQRCSHSLANLPVQGLSELQVVSWDFYSMNL